MTDKYIFYEVDGKNLKVPASQQKEFEGKIPDAKMMLTFDGKNHKIPVSRINEVVEKVGADNLTYSVFDDKRQYDSKLSTDKIFSYDESNLSDFVNQEDISEPAYISAIRNPNLSRKEKRQAVKAARESGEIPSFWESIGKAGEVAGISIGKGSLDLVNESAKIGKAAGGAQNPLAGLAATIESITGQSISSEDNPLEKASINMSEASDKLRKDADPTGGRMDYIDLLKEGQIGLALQSAAASGVESIPVMAATKSPWLASFYILSSAASNYADEARENPDIPAWKIGLNSLFKSTLELAVERVADPLSNLIRVGGGKLTEDAAKKIIKEFSDKGSKEIGKRIFNYVGGLLKGAGKNALGEGIEEGVTALGNDLIGSALDAIDGNSDYGFAAQWKDYKKENPDASLWDFSLAKGREYLNASVGGALSGAEISTTATTVGDAFKYRGDKKAQNLIDLAHAYGESMDYENVYDTNETVAESLSAATELFVDEKGNPIISEEYLSELSSDDLLGLSRNADITREQREALGTLAAAKATQEGLSSKLDSRTESEVNAQKILIEEASENGSIVAGIYNDRAVYVKGAIASNGTVSLADGDKGPVIVIDAKTGEKSSVNSDDIKNAESYNAEVFSENIENTIRESHSRMIDEVTNIMSPRAKAKAIKQYDNSKILIKSGDALIQVEVQKILPDGNVLLKGKKGDLGGQSELLMPASQFYDSIARNEDGTPIFVEALPQREQTTEEPETQTEPQQTAEEQQDFREYVGPILINGVPVEVEVTEQDDTSNKVSYRYTNENGQQKIGSTNVADFANAVKQAEQKKTEEPIVDNTTETVTPTVDETVASTTTETTTETNENVNTEPEEVDYDALFETDKEAFFNEIQNQFGDEAVDVLNDFINAAQQELDALNKSKAAGKNGIVKSRSAKAALQSEIDALNEMVQRLTAAPAEEIVDETTVAEAKPEVGAEPTVETQTEQAVDNIPDVSVDKSADARARGFRMTNGQRVDRRGETIGVYGKETDITFTADSKGKRIGKVKVIDAGSLIPSHISGVENVEHFIPEAQPKKRTDKASTVSATLIAQNMDSPKMTNVVSSAYEGAPIVNRRGEVIQGNNRSAAILEMYQSHPDKAAEYKQYILDHASDFGLNAEEVAAMQNPVLVRELDVDDTDAITLGQYTMQDMESGGNQMIDSGRAIAGLSNKGLLEDFITRLLAEENEEASDMNLSDLITRNGNEALKMLYQNGIINQTQYQSALGANGRITADARAALRGIIEQQLFAGGIDNLSVMFEVLPDKAKKAIMQTIARDLKNPDDAKVAPYLQEAIEVYYQLNQQPDFVVAKKEGEIDKSIDAFKGQTNALEDGTPADKYTNFAFELAKSFKFKTLKQQREYLNSLYDAIAGIADIFGESEGKPLGEAVAEVYETNLNKANNETNGKSGAVVLEGSNGRSQEGEQGSTEVVGVRTDASESGQGATDGGANKTVGRGSETTGEVKPVAPNPVSNPTQSAKDREKILLNLVERDGVDENLKIDSSRRAGKEVADMFATYDEYEDYQATATDFGEYNKYFEEGVKKSFANRNNELKDNSKYSYNAQNDNIQESELEAERDSASSNRGVNGGLSNNAVNSSNTSRYEGRTLERYKESVERIRKSLEKYALDIANISKKYPEFANIIDKFYNDIFYRNSGMIELNASEFIRDIRNAYGDSANDLIDLLSSIKDEQLAIRNIESDAALSEFGLSQNEVVPYDTVKNIFDSFSPENYEKILFDRLIDLANRFDVKIIFTTKQNYNAIASDGVYDGNRNILAIDASLLCGLNPSNTIDITNRLVHELLHSVTTRGFYLKNRYDFYTKAGYHSTAKIFELPSNVKEALDIFEGIYESIKNDPAISSEYGVHNVKEMVAELSNPVFRKKLEDNGLWSRVKKAFVKLLSYVSGNKQTSTLSALEDAVDKLLSELETGSADYAYTSQLVFPNNAIIDNGLVDFALSKSDATPTQVAKETAAQVYDREVNSTWNEFQRQFQDAFQPVRIAIDAIQNETGNIPVEDYENYLLIQNQSSSRSRNEIDKFVRRYYSPIIKQVNKAIDKIMESRGFKLNDKEKRAEVYKEVINYLIAKHGLERNAYYQNAKGEMRDYAGLTALFGLDSKEFAEAERHAQELVDKFESEIDTEALWSKINAATNKTLRHSYESGLLSRQQYEDIKEMFKFYIPLRGFDETTAEDIYSYARFEGNRFNPAVQKASGRTSLADDPIAIIMNMAESEIAQGNKNRAKQALYNYLLNRASENNEQNSLMQIEDVWYVISTDANGNKIYQIAAPDHAAGETYEAFDNRMQALAAQGLAEKSKKGKVDVGMRFQKQMNQSAHYVYLKVNGVDKAIYVNGDPKIADAINGKGAGQLSEGVKKFKDVQRIISSTFTNYSLEFTARNYFRDMIYSHINIGVRESDPAYRKKFRQNWRHNNMRSMLSMLKAYRAGEFDSRALTADEAAFVEFMENGGQTGYTLINSVESHKKDLESAIKRMQDGIENGGIKDSTIFKATLGGIELLNEASELVTRFAAFKTSRDMGRSVVKSISDAKEITVNFNTKGAQDNTSKNWMGVVSHYFGWSKFFFNASVQGVQNVKAMADANRLKFCGVVGGMAATGFLMPVVISAISEILGGDDEEEYWNIPEYERQNNLCIPLGNGKYAKIALPIGFREVYAIGDMVAAMLMDKKFTRDAGQVGMDIANKIASVVLPINPLESTANGLSIWHTMAYTLAPSSAQVIIQNATNVDWKGAPLQKEYTYNENDPQWMKAFASNPGWMTGLSKWCNENVKLGDDYQGIDWSPEKLDNTLSNLLGGVYTLVKKSGRSISMIWNEENRKLSNIPLAGVALGSGIDSDDRFITDAYYDMQEYYDDNVNYIKRRAEKFGYTLEEVFVKEKGKHHPKMLEIYDNNNFDFMQEWYKGNEELNEITKEIKKLKKQIAEKENPSMQLLEKLAKKESKLEAERREFVNDMLELD